MSNVFGRWLRFSTWGESHGPSMGVMIDDVPPGIRLTEQDIQPYLDARKPGTSRFVTQRREPDEARIVSGVFEGVTTGMPLTVVIDNQDARSRDYGSIRDLYRPGHADVAWQMKYGVRDYRGGGRSSARETAMRVVAGAVARRVLFHELGGDRVVIRGSVVEIGGIAIDRDRWDDAVLDESPLRCPDPVVVEQWSEILDRARRDGTSLGAVVEVTATGVPPGLGSPVYGKLDADLALGMMGINAVKGVEIGDGFACARSDGLASNDVMSVDEAGELVFASNHAGGTLGGVSTGQPVVVRLALKPTSSVRVEQTTVTSYGETQAISTTGRHDPCVGIRAVPVAEAMLAFVLADHVLGHKAQTGRRAVLCHTPFPLRRGVPSSEDPDAEVS